MPDRQLSSPATMTHSSSRTETPRIVETEFHVRYAETDAMGVVHHATYLVYFEEGRSHYMRAMDSDYAEIEAQGYQLPVTEVAVRFAGSLCYGQRVRIRTWIEENRSRQLTFAYEVVDADSRASLVTGFTRHVWTDRKGHVTRQPAVWREKFAEFA
jgi:acyl-CoA thioester hydrolase